MKLMNEKYAGTKLSTNWGVMEVDAKGCVEIEDSHAAVFFQDKLQFKLLGGKKAASVMEKAAAQVEAEKTAARKAEEEAELAKKQEIDRLNKEAEAEAAEEAAEETAEETEAVVEEKKKSKWSRSR